MKKHKILLTMCAICVMLFGSVITCHAAITGARATRFGLTTNEGNYIAYNDMVCDAGYDYTLTQLQTETYKDYSNYAILHYGNENEENYVVTFVMEGQSVMYDPLVSSGKYYPRIRATNTQYITYACKYNVATDSWSVRPQTAGAPYQTDPAFYEGYNLEDEASMKQWTKEHIAYLNADILDTDKTSVFYQAPKVVLAPIVGEIPMKGATEQILAMIPICLALLVGYLGLRKALSILQAILHRA